MAAMKPWCASTGVSVVSIEWKTSAVVHARIWCVAFGLGEIKNEGFRHEQLMANASLDVTKLACHDFKPL